MTSLMTRTGRESEHRLSPAIVSRYKDSACLFRYLDLQLGEISFLNIFECLLQQKIKRRATPIITTRLTDANIGWNFLITYA